MKAYDHVVIFGAMIRRTGDPAFTGGIEMFASTAGLALALQLGGSVHPLNDGVAFVLEVRSYRQGRPPPCGHGYDLDERDGKCYPNGAVPPRFQSGRYFPLEYGGGRRPVPCGHGTDLDIRDRLCYPNGAVPRQYQDGRPGYHTRRNGYYEMR